MLKSVVRNGLRNTVALSEAAIFCQAADRIGKIFGKRHKAETVKAVSPGHFPLHVIDHSQPGLYYYHLMYSDIDLKTGEMG
jgi:hypothetical protein